MIHHSSHPFSIQSVLLWHFSAIFKYHWFQYQPVLALWIRNCWSAVMYSQPCTYSGAKHWEHCSLASQQSFCGMTQFTYSAIYNIYEVAWYSNENICGEVSSQLYYLVTSESGQAMQVWNCCLNAIAENG